VLGPSHVDRTEVAEAAAGRDLLPEARGFSAGELRPCRWRERGREAVVSTREQRLSGRVSLVTGGARRIGRLIVERLAAAGSAVIIHHHRSGTEAEAVAVALRRRGGVAFILQADLSSEDAVEALLSRAEALAGPVDLLVNNASVFPEGTLDGLTPATLEQVLRVNTYAPLFLARALHRRGREGHVVNLLDTRVVRHDPGHFAYQISKQALYSLTRALALELAPRIAVNAVAPGPALPPEGADEGYLERLARTTPLQRSGGAEEVAEAVRFLVESDHITGQVIFVDGGGHLRGGIHG
jgi:NAD(P)-dependent dehydrogenase (short-subunit alcohol dehydrogenase family)